eukprot:TRINITY_DN4164_c0_g1_i1.p1 TRINITY_DN4164_c0_g1~~TRINITY_DN4164_c0_g1_i1.p1  ORF type:complete len:1319 (-),score=333.06 TRINITY_DN4164_c0_g1_i1:118-3849(-)
MTVQDVLLRECSKRDTPTSAYTVWDKDGHPLLHNTLLSSLTDHVVVLKFNDKRPPKELSQDLCSTVEKKRLDIIKEMLDAEFYRNALNTPSLNGETALYLAAKQGHPEITVQLLISGADVDFQDPNNGHTPLHMAAISGDLGTTAALLLAGADPSVLNNEGLTPCQMADGIAASVLNPNLTAKDITSLHPALSLMKQPKLLSADPDAEKKREKREKKRQIKRRLQKLDMLANTLLKSEQQLQSTDLLFDDYDHSSSSVGQTPADPSPSEVEDVEEEKKAKKLEWRKNVINEVITTERSFVEDMDLLLEVFVVPLEKAGLLSATETKILFSNISEVVSTNKKMANKFEERRDQITAQNLGVSEMLIGDIFIDMSASLSIYQDYCTNQTEAFQYLEYLKATKPEFQAFLDEAMKSPQCRGLDLQAWLIKPLQRLCKYPILLRELLASTSVSSTDYKQIQEASVKIGKVVGFINTAKSYAEALAQIENEFFTTLQNSIKDGSKEIVQAGRKLVKYGDLLEYKRVKDKYLYKSNLRCFLFSDMILVCDVQYAKQMKVRAMIELNRVRITVFSNDVVENGFEFTIIGTKPEDPEVKIALATGTEPEKLAWLKDIKTKIKEYQQQRFNKATSRGGSLADVTLTNASGKQDKKKVTEMLEKLSVLDGLEEQILEARKKKMLQESNPGDSKAELEVSLDKEKEKAKEEEEEEETPEKTEKRKAQRKNVITEILNTEEDYIKDLELIEKLFINPLNKSGVLTNYETKVLFSNVLDLIALNKELSERFLERKLETTVLQRKDLSAVVLGDIFSEMSVKLSQYKEYCTNQTEAFVLLEDLKITNPEFKIFCEEKETDPECRGLNLQAWLIKPLQRICKYPLLLRELVRCTKEGETGYQDLLDAQTRIGELVLFINTAKLQSEHIADLETQFFKLLESLVKDKEGLAKPGRCLISAGRLREKKSSGKNPVLRCYLFSDLLLLCQVHKSTGKMETREKIMLNDLKITVLGDDDSGRGFELENGHGNKYVLSAGTQIEKENWVKEIKAKIKDYQQQRFRRTGTVKLQLSHSKSHSSLVASPPKISSPRGMEMIKRSPSDGKEDKKEDKKKRIHLRTTSVRKTRLPSSADSDLPPAEREFLELLEDFNPKFKKYLEKKYEANELHFWTDVQQFKINSVKSDIKMEDLLLNAKSIATKYIALDCLEPVRISSKEIGTIMKSLEDREEISTIFNVAQQEAFQLMFEKHFKGSSFDSSSKK